MYYKNITCYIAYRTRVCRILIRINRDSLDDSLNKITKLVKSAYF